jgi:DNA repair protein RadC
LLGAREVILEGLQADLATRPVDPACPKLNQYLMASMGSLPDEVLRILFLDAAHHLIADEQLHSGSVRHLELYPRTIFRRALEHGATGIILVHNHPSGAPAPSENDILATRKLSKIGRALDIEIIDHIIVTASGVHSLSTFAPETSVHPTAASQVLRDSFCGGDQPVSIALDNARRTYHRRKYRRELIGSEDLFGEPAWDMLIHLFIHGCKGKKVAISALCSASSASASTALRMVNKLCAASLIVKIEDPDDARRHFVELMPNMASRMEAYFGT